jgi:hypothetical protein
MNVQVQRLEELLVRIERNRRNPRRPVGMNTSATSMEQAVEGREVSPAPVPPTAPGSRPQIEQLPVSPKIEVPQATAPQAIHTEQLPSSPKIEVAQAIAPQAAIKAEPVQPVVVVPAAVVLPVHAVAKVVSEVAKIDEPTFGQLLRRSLSLRPS